MRVAKSVISVAKSTSSTVQVFLMAVLYMWKKTGYFIGRRVREKPGSNIMRFCLSVLLTSFARSGIFQRANESRFVHDGRDGGFGDARGRPRAQVISCLQSLFPRVHIHGGDFVDGRTLHE